MRATRKIGGSILVAVFVAGLVTFTVPAVAQPPGDKDKSFEKYKGKGKGFEKGEKGEKGEKKFDPKGGESPQAKELQSALEKLRAEMIELEQKLQKVKGEPGKPNFAPFGPGFKGPPVMVFEKMSAQELKDLINKLQNVLDDKTRGDKPTKPTGDKPTKPTGDKTTKPTGDKTEASGQDAILQRLDKLTREIDEIRKSIKK